MNPVEPNPVQEVDAGFLLAPMQDGNLPLILDCREPYEWRQARIPGSLHIPMDLIPDRLHELQGAADIVVVCAHGIRSYAVAEFLVRQGFPARSLRGGILEWYLRHGPLEMSPPSGGESSAGDELAPDD